MLGGSASHPTSAEDDARPVPVDLRHRARSATAERAAPETHAGLPGGRLRERRGKDYKSVAVIARLGATPRGARGSAYATCCRVSRKRSYSPDLSKKSSAPTNSHWRRYSALA